MKRIVTALVKSLGGSTAYSGNNGIMFINDPLADVVGTDGVLSIEQMVTERYPDLPFILITNKS